MLQLKTLNKKSRIVSPISTPFRYSCTRIPTTNKPNICGEAVKTPVVGFILIVAPGPSGFAAEKPEAQVTGK
jgi:hypothetical protein